MVAIHFSFFISQPAVIARFFARNAWQSQAITTRLLRLRLAMTACAGFFQKTVIKSSQKTAGKTPVKMLFLG